MTTKGDSLLLCFPVEWLSNVMRTINIPDTIRYQIKHHAEGATLCLWETARPTETRDQPFLFKINQKVASKEEAQQLLRYYLEEFRAV